MVPSLIYLGIKVFSGDLSLDFTKLSASELVSILLAFFSISLSAAFYFADEFRRSQFERLDLRLARHIFKTGYSYEFAVTMQHYLDKDTTDLSPDNIIRDHNQFFAEVGVRF
mgnify:CR=1 FL=1